MRILPDGTVEIRNKNTGATKVVQPADLPNYGIPYTDYATQLKAAKSVGVQTTATIDETTPATEQKQNEANKVKQDMIGVATELQNTIANKNQYSPEAYKSAIEALSSSLVAKKKEAEGYGANLTGNELAIMTGQVPRIQMRGPNVFEKLAGIVPPQSGKVQDDEKTIQLKTQLLIAGLKGEKITPEMLNEATQNQQSQDKSVGGLVGNAGNNVKDILNSILGIPAATLNRAKTAINNPQEALKEQYSLPNILQAAAGPQMAVANEANQVAGEPLKGGDIVGRAVNRAYEKPVTTAMDLLPFLGFKKPVTQAGQVLKGAEEATQLSKGVAENVAGRRATAIAAPDMSSVGRSEKLMSDVLKITDAPTVRGMAKQLEGFVPKASNYIRNKTMELDKTIGPQSGSDIVNTVLKKISDSAEARANPELLKQIQDKLQNQLYGGELPEGVSRGEFWNTTLENIDKTRKYFNSGKDNWFKAGKPVDSATNNLKSLEWQSSQALREILAEVSDEIKPILSLEHSAIETMPVLAEQALKGMSNNTSIRGMLLNILKPVLEPLKVKGARKLQGQPPEILKRILQPENGQEIISPVPETINPTRPSTPTSRQPLQENIIDKILKGKGPAQSTRLIRDMRYKQGNPQFRGTQEDLINQAKKKKYK